MKRKKRFCVVSPEYAAKEKKAAPKTVFKIKKFKKFPLRASLYILPLLLSALLLLTGFVEVGYNVFLGNKCAGVVPAGYTAEKIASMLESPPKDKVKLYPCFVTRRNYTPKDLLCQSLMLIDGQLFEGTAFVCGDKRMFVMESEDEVKSIVDEYISTYKTENTTIAVLNCIHKTENGIYKAQDKSDRENALAALREIEVITADFVSAREKVACETETIEDSSQKEGVVTVACEGSDGEIEVVKEIRRINGNVAYERVVEQKIIVVPVSRIEKRGTKVLSGIGTGKFVRPASGEVSSNFGQRWGKNHNGTDFLGNIGDPVSAADSGTVSFSGEADGFGTLIIIDHKNGFETYYGHLSKSFVSEGDKVEPGEIIGEIGSSGNSTGPHLHFEIRKHKIPVNPISFL